MTNEIHSRTFDKMKELGWQHDKPTFDDLFELLPSHYWMHVLTINKHGGGTYSARYMRGGENLCFMSQAGNPLSSTSDTPADALGKLCCKLVEDFGVDVFNQLSNTSAT